MNKGADNLLGRDAAVLRVRGALAFNDATRPGAGPLTDAAILVRDGKIAGVGAAADPATADPRALEVGGDCYWIIPGLVNAHSHGRGLGWFRLGAPDDAAPGRSAPTSPTGSSASPSCASSWYR